MIPRIEMERREDGQYDYRVTLESEILYADEGFSAVLACLVSAIEGLAPDVRAVEVSFQSVISGTYPLQMVAMHPQQVAQHAADTTASVFEALSG